MIGRRLIFAIGAAAAFSAVPARGQQVLPSECGTCRLFLHTYDRVGVNAGAALQDHAALAFAGDGWLVSRPAGTSAPVMALRGGTLKEVGPRGYGEGEIPERGPHAIGVSTRGEAWIATEDRVLLLDSTMTRVAAHVPLPRLPRGMFSTATHLLVGEYVLLNQHGSRDIRVLDRSGRQIRQFRAEMKLGAFDLLNIAPSGDTAVWISSFYAYRADLVRLDGKLLRTVQRSSDWFGKPSYRAGEGVTEPISPKIVGIRELAPDLLLFVFAAPDPHWARGQVAAKPGEPDNSRDTILEVVEIENGRLLSSVLYDEMLRPVHGTGLLWAPAMDGAGGTQPEVYRIDFRR